MKWICHYCSYEANNYNDLGTHELERHNLFKGTDTNITEETISKLRTTMAKVKWLLEEYPSTRGDDRVMYLMYMRIFDKSMVYNPDTKLIEFRNKAGISYEDWRNLTSFETIRRSRQKVQELWQDLKPSELVQIKRSKREDAIRGNIKTISIDKQEYDSL